MYDTEVYYAHTPNKDGEWHTLSEHLTQVAELTSRFASRFGYPKLGKVIGQIHDIGKFNPKFQKYLKSCYETEQNKAKSAQKVPHSVYAGKVSKNSIIAIVAICHHIGLKSPSEIKQMIAATKDEEWLPSVVESCKDIFGCKDIESPEHDAFETEFLLRMLYSSLVDADWLDTERHFDREKYEKRKINVTLDQLWQVFEENQKSLMSGINESSSSLVNQARKEVYEACLSAAINPPGVYRLTVPTGGGKTRSGMAFALKHALHNGLDRIIVAIPYTSIIDQNVQVYKSIFGDENVLEHHSAILEPFDPDESQNELELRRKLSSENWDVPIVVTTTVQLFESIFSNTPSRCRKLHNIANSVILLDEVQTLPINLLQPILNILRELVSNYNVSVVLSTATQPALSNESRYIEGFDKITDIVPRPELYFQKLKRVNYKIVQGEFWVWEKVAEELLKRDQVLCVLNSRKDALELFNLIDSSDAFHLSTLMCPAHRRDTLNEIRERLLDGKTCRVVSTQVVEAGVDLDFPSVFRAIGPLDRIVQAAGRCNREGKLHEGEVVVFTPSNGRNPSGSYRTAIDESIQVLSQPKCDLHSPEVFELYYSKLWGTVNLDSKEITNFRKQLDFPEVAKRFKMIDDDTIPVVVSYGPPGPTEILKSIRNKGFVSLDDWRKLQAYNVNIYRWQFQQYCKEHLLSKVNEDLFEWIGDYNHKTGISKEFIDPADLIA